MLEFAWKCLAMCVVCFGWMHLVILWHELGHAFFGLLAGFHPRTITVGRSPHLRVHLGRGIVFQWGLVPSYGLVLSDQFRFLHSPPATWRRRLLTYLAGGLVFDVFLLSITFGLTRSLHTIWLAAPFLLHLVMTFSNAWPRSNRIEGRDLASDGANLLSIAKTDYVAMMGQVREWLGRVAARYGATELSPRICEPEFLCAVARTQTDRIARRHGEAIEGLRKLSEEEAITDTERSFLLDHMASIALDDPGGERLAEALSWAEMAISLNPSRITLHASRASLLVRLSRFQEARPLVDLVLAESTETVDQVMSALDMAEILADEGDRIEAARWLAKARDAAGSEFGFLDRIHAASERIGIPLPPKNRPET